MRVAVEIHVLRLVERSLHGVVALSFVGGIPVSDGGTRRDLHGAGAAREFGVVKGAPGLLFAGVDFSGPSRDGDSATGNRTRAVLRLNTGGYQHRQNHGKANVKSHFMNS